MMDKPKYRYNHKTGEWDQLYIFNKDVTIIPGWRRPDGSLASFTLPYDHSLVDYYRNNLQEKQ